MVSTVLHEKGACKSFTGFLVWFLGVGKKVGKEGKWLSC